LEVYDVDDVESMKRIDPKEHNKILLERRKKEKLKLPDILLEYNKPLELEKESGIISCAKLRCK
jgi:hypothetical protein